MFKTFWIVLFVISSFTALGQKGVFNQKLMPGPDGVLVFAIDARKDIKSVYTISRTGKNARKLATLSFPASVAELEKKLGGALLNEILRQRKLRSATDLYAQLSAGRLDTLGLYLTLPPVLEALGFLYIDKEITRPTDEVGYKVEVGNRLLYQQSLREVKYSDFPKFKLYHRTATDSAAMVTWYAVGGHANYARVYRNSSEQTRLFVHHRRDTLFATYSTNTKPGEQLSLSVRAIDMAGNMGSVSDTVHLLALTLTDTYTVTGLTAADTLNGILLRWKQLPAKAYFTGIRVLKSRTATKDFMVADTLPATATAWIDRKIIPGAEYYYLVEPIVYDLPQHMTITPARVTMNTKGSHLKPLAPQHINIAYTKDRHVKISWMPNSELNAFAYYVLRGTSRANMQVVSPAVRDTMFIDSLQNLHAGYTYLYAVTCMDMQMNRSDTSAFVSIMPAKGKVVTAPAGLAARYTEQGVKLLWNNVAQSESSVTGYIVYKRKKGEKYFAPVINSLIPGNYYTDTAINTPGVYEYGCVSVDAVGNQSILSSIAEVTITGSTWLYPPADFNVRNLSAGIEISIPASLNAKSNYVIYRRLAANRWQKIAESTGLYIDKQVSKAQLYVYAVATKLPGMESSKSPEKSIRRK